MHGHTIFFPTFEGPLIKLYVCVFYKKLWWLGKLRWVPVQLVKSLIIK